MENKELIKESLKAQELAYSPYSNCKVGAAVLLKDGKVFTGSNVENAAYGPTVCAERNAIFKAVNAGYRKGDFEKIAITANWDDIVCPCGVCRQVMAEFFTKETLVVISKNGKEHIVTRFGELLPLAFISDAIAENLSKK